MARMHSRDKGKSKSVRPVKKTNLSWLTYKAKEVEMLVSKLAKEGKTASKIGLYLRDNYGIPSVKRVTEKTITQILAEKKLVKEIPEDLMALIKRTVILRKHLEKNHKDEPAKRGLHLTESKIKRLVKYYKSSKKLSMDWKYDPERIKLFIE
jgi:small subunit ribosomal protein S15|tara:strand:- start:644 stop:1099 length:456 start_codon:yes stop_codon:yes gene_type:complete